MRCRAARVLTAPVPSMALTSGFDQWYQGVPPMDSSCPSMTLRVRCPQNSMCRWHVMSMVAIKAHDRPASYVSV